MLPWLIAVAALAVACVAYGILVERRRQSGRDHSSVDVVHDVERDAEQGVVLAYGANVRDADPERCERELQARLAHDVVRRGRQRRPWRPPQHVPRSVVALEQEGEVRAAALADPVRLQRARSQSVLVEERTDRFQDQQRRALVVRRAIVRVRWAIEKAVCL